MSSGSVVSRETRLTGLGVSPGIVVGTALCLERGGGNVFQRRLMSTSQVKQEIARLNQAIATTKEQLQVIKDRLEHALGQHQAYIIDAHILMLEDNALLQDVEAIIEHEAVNAEWAVKVVGDRLLRVYDSIKDDYLRERGADFEDVLNRLQQVLSGQRGFSLGELADDVIVIAEDIPPSHAAELDLKHVLGFGTEAGGWTSHTAIIARSLGIPAVVGLHDILQKAATGDRLILDGTEGTVIINPSVSLQRQYLRRRVEQRRAQRRLKKHTLEPAFTQDGHPFTIRANIEVMSDLEAVRESGATGIGLYRSEFLLVQGKHGLPDEAEQFAEYRRIAQSVGGSVASIRAFDLGGDKTTDKKHQREHNPALGLRGIRLLLHEPEIFYTQLRALLRASHYGRLRLILPMVTDISELRAARRMLAEVKTELQAAGLPFDPSLPLGVMVEVPAAVLSIDALAREADFFSLGTNDLIQYLLAVDRSNEGLSQLYQPLHPAVLRAIRQTVAAARQAGIPVEVCGEMAANPIQAAMLIGLGLRTLSLTPASIPIIKKLIRTVNLQELEVLTDELLEKCGTTKEVEDFLYRELPLRFPQFFAAWFS